jgi:hypothetical protein
MRQSHATREAAGTIPASRLFERSWLKTRNLHGTDWQRQAWRKTGNSDHSDRSEAEKSITILPWIDGNGLPSTHYTIKRGTDHLGAGIPYKNSNCRRPICLHNREVRSRCVTHDLIWPQHQCLPTQGTGSHIRSAAMMLLCQKYHPNEAIIRASLCTILKGWNKPSGTQLSRPLPDSGIISIGPIDQRNANASRKHAPHAARSSQW